MATHRASILFDAGFNHSPFESEASPIPSISLQAPDARPPLGADDQQIQNRHFGQPRRIESRSKHGKSCRTRQITSGVISMPRSLGPMQHEAFALSSRSDPPIQLDIK